MPSISGSLNAEECSDVNFCVALRSPCTIIRCTAVIQPIERCQCDVVQQKIEVVSLKQAFPVPEVWQVLFTILTGLGNMVLDDCWQQEETAH